MPRRSAAALAGVRDWTGAILAVPTQEFGDAWAKEQFGDEWQSQHPSCRATVVKCRRLKINDKTVVQ